MEVRCRTLLKKETIYLHTRKRCDVIAMKFNKSITSINLKCNKYQNLCLLLIYKSSPTNLKKKITRHVYVRLDWGSKSLSSFLEVIKLINNHSVVTGPPHTPSSSHSSPLPARFHVFYIQSSCSFLCVG